MSGGQHSAIGYQTDGECDSGLSINAGAGRRGGFQSPIAGYRLLQRRRLRIPSAEFSDRVSVISSQD
jgi:hypothetical protein